MLYEVKEIEGISILCDTSEQNYSAIGKDSNGQSTVGNGITIEEALSSFQKACEIGVFSI